MEFIFRSHYSFAAHADGILVCNRRFPYGPPREQGPWNKITWHTPRSMVKPYTMMALPAVYYGLCYVNVFYV